MERNPTAPRPGGQDELTAEETAQVLKRAAQLGAPESAEAGGASLALSELEKIGLESGMSREAIRRAYLELRMGKLGPKKRAGLADGLLGPESIGEERLFPLSPDAAERRLDAELKRELLHAEERDGARATWTAAPGLWASIQRGMNWQGQSSWGGAELTSEVSEGPSLGGGAQALVRLDATAGARTGPLWSAAWAGLVPALAAAICLSQQVMDGFAAMVCIAAAASALAFAVHRRARRRHLRSLRAGVTRVLDRIAGR